MADPNPKRVKRDQPPKTTRAGHIAIVGRPNVGKSTLLNALLGESIAITSHHPQTTRDRILGVVSEADTQFIFVDTPGVHRAKTMLGARMNQEARDAARGADVIVFMTDIGRDASDVHLRPADLAILKDLPAGIPVLCVLNKIDRLEDKTELVKILQGHASGHDFAAIIPLSARKSSEMKYLLGELRERLPFSKKLFDDETLTDRPVRFLVAEFVREQILRHTREEVPHGVAVVVERFEEGKPPKEGKTGGKTTRIELAVHVDREGHKKIIIGKGGALLKEIGMEARAKVEAMMGQKVHLQIWVRVTPGWYESDKGLREMGYGSPES